MWINFRASEQQQCLLIVLPNIISISIQHIS